MTWSSATDVVRLPAGLGQGVEQPIADVAESRSLPEDPLCDSPLGSRRARGAARGFGGRPGARASRGKCRSGPGRPPRPAGGVAGSAVSGPSSGCSSHGRRPGRPLGRQRRRPRDRRGRLPHAVLDLSDDAPSSPPLADSLSTRPESFGHRRPGAGWRRPPEGRHADGPVASVTMAPAAVISEIEPKGRRRLAVGQVNSGRRAIAPQTSLARANNLQAAANMAASRRRRSGTAATGRRPGSGPPPWRSAWLPSSVSIGRRPPQTATSGWRAVGWPARRAITLPPFCTRDLRGPGPSRWTGRRPDDVHQQSPAYIAGKSPITLQECPPTRTAFSVGSGAGGARTGPHAPVAASLATGRCTASL
jgi:hypothetical protein